MRCLNLKILGAGSKGSLFENLVIWGFVFWGFLCTVSPINGQFPISPPNSLCSFCFVITSLTALIIQTQHKVHISTLHNSRPFWQATRQQLMQTKKWSHWGPFPWPQRAAGRPEKTNSLIWSFPLWMSPRKPKHTDIKVTHWKSWQLHS